MEEVEKKMEGVGKMEGIGEKCTIWKKESDRWYTGVLRENGKQDG